MITVKSIWNQHTFLEKASLRFKPSALARRSAGPGFFLLTSGTFSARAVEPTEAVVFKADALRNKAKETPAFGYDLALRVGGIMMQQLQSTRIRLLDICEVS